MFIAFQAQILFQSAYPRNSRRAWGVI